LKPFYWIIEQLPALCDGARRLGLVTLDQMVAALVLAVEHPPPAGTVRIVGVPAIRASNP
jgi:nucleoside-diphosphate-sugar epimerase